MESGPPETPTTTPSPGETRVSVLMTVNISFSSGCMVIIDNSALIIDNYRINF
jgi:hypothetical protein